MHLQHARIGAAAINKIEEAVIIVGADIFDTHAGLFLQLFQKVDQLLECILSINLKGIDVQSRDPIRSGAEIGLRADRLKFANDPENCGRFGNFRPKYGFIREPLAIHSIDICTLRLDIAAIGLSVFGAVGRKLSRAMRTIRIRVEGIEKLLLCRRVLPFVVELTLH